jgi:hypothetical protein
LLNKNSALRAAFLQYIKERFAVFLSFVRLCLPKLKMQGMHSFSAPAALAFYAFYDCTLALNNIFLRSAVCIAGFFARFCSFNSLKRKKAGRRSQLLRLPADIKLNCFIIRLL